MEITDKEYERIVKDYLMVLDKHRELDYAYLDLEKRFNSLKDLYEKLFKANIRLTTENRDLKKLIGLIEGKLLECCEMIDKGVRKE